MIEAGRRHREKVGEGTVHLIYPFFFFFFAILGPHLPYMEVPRLGVQSELQLPAYATLWL